MNLKEKAKKLPLSPGVYRFLDKNGKILYIGRATSLRKRVLQYFRLDLDPRIAEMVELANDLSYETTETVLESIFLEANLIKKFWPKYNVKDKDNRSFVYVAIPKQEYSHPLIIRERELKKFPTSTAKIYGPYQSQYLIKSALKIIRRIFPYSTCKPKSGRPCFDYQINLCPGICIDKITAKQYQENIKNISLLLAGEKKLLMKKLKKENPEAIEALKHIQDVSLITNSELNGHSSLNRIEGYDISHLAGRETVGSMVVFTNGTPDKVNYRLFNVKTAPLADDLRALEEVLTRRFGHPEWAFPELIMIDGGKPQILFVAQVLKKININIPIVGISKLAGDKLVFSSGVSKTSKTFAEGLKPILISVRDEAHRFSRQASRRQRRLK